MSGYNNPPKDISTTSISNELDKLEKRTADLHYQLKTGKLAAVNYNVKYDEAVKKAIKAIQHLHNADIEAARLDELERAYKAVDIDYKAKRTAELQSIQEKNT